ncbi:MAG TPA: pseudouridine-5'-phosphate glycosidase, partial [Acidimicrobiia bacterium]|nr:pseudouridine-5'-phosphate glycosidase [Acidimicrobiia bacterium]
GGEVPVDAADAARAGVAGGAVTPHVIERIAAATAGRTVAANVALVEHNAAVAAGIAAELAQAPRDRDRFRT